eukprot:5981486-Prymnesium_polylepis.1
MGSVNQWTMRHGIYGKSNTPLAAGALPAGGCVQCPEAPDSRAMPMVLPAGNAVRKMGHSPLQNQISMHQSQAGHGEVHAWVGQ